MYQLQMQQKFQVSLDQLYDAWCNVDTIKRWFAPGDMSVLEAQADVREGGRYRIVMQENDGTQHIVGGQYLEIVANEKMVFDWQWEGSPTTTTVSLVFSAVDDHVSLLELTHIGFIDQDSCDHHQQGWTGCLGNLTQLTANATARV